MTRISKIQKLANAIKEYRGLYREESGQWIHLPKHNKISRVVACLNRLNLPVTESVYAINKFNHVREYEAWIKAI